MYQSQQQTLEQESQKHLTIFREASEMELPMQFDVGPVFSSLNQHALQPEYHQESGQMPGINPSMPGTILPQQSTGQMYHPQGEQEYGNVWCIAKLIYDCVP